MEAQRRRPKHRFRLRQARDNVDQNVDVEQEDAVIEELIEDAKRLDIRIAEQETELNAKRTAFEESKEKSKESVKDLFAELRHILETKERETLEDIDHHYETCAFNVLSEYSDKCITDIRHVGEMLQNDAKMIKKSSVDSINHCLAYLKHGVIQRDNMTINNVEPSINSDIKEMLHQWECVSFETNYHDTNNAQGAVETNTRQIGDDELGNESLGETDDDYYEDEDVNENGRTGENGGLDTPLSTSSVSEAAVRPSAPPLQPAQAEEEDPPPYWQAVGLSGPEAVVQPASPPAVPDLNTRTYEDAAPRYYEASAPLEETVIGRPDNTLENWHSFPSRRQYDHRSTLSICLSWEHGIVCLGDKGNRKVKFFTPSGVLLSELQINGEIHDVAFLERYDDVSRYIVSLPSICTVMIISINGRNLSKIVRQIPLRDSTPYNCISRGPRDQTIVGGSGIPSHHPPCVDVVRLDGTVVQKFKLTPNYKPFKYPKAVAVFSQFIIISDWSLNVVCVFSSNGSPVGEYTGTSTVPLIDPLDITLDHFGNIMVLDGQFPNIHVMDLKCTPIEVIKLPHSSSDNSNTKLLAFDTEKKMMATSKNNGQIAIYSFRAGYRGIRQGEVTEIVEERREPVVLPLIEGMLPSTIESMRSRPRARARSAIYHL